MVGQRAVARSPLAERLEQTGHIAPLEGPGKMGIQEVDEVKGLLLAQPRGQTAGADGKADPFRGLPVGVPVAVGVEHFAAHLREHGQQFADELGRAAGVDSAVCEPH